MSMYLIIYFLLPLFIQEGVPFKPKDEYEFTLDYQFRNKAGVDRFEVDWSSTKKYSEGTLPFVTIKIKLLKLSEEEERAKIITNLGHRIYSRKASLDNEIEIEMGFTDDLKDHISVFEYDVIFFSKRNDVSRINLYVDEDGSFLINGEKRGKF